MLKDKEKNINSKKEEENDMTLEDKKKIKMLKDEKNNGNCLKFLIF